MVGTAAVEVHSDETPVVQFVSGFYAAVRSEICLSQAAIATIHNLPRLGSVGLVDLGLGYGCLTELTEVPG